MRVIHPTTLKSASSRAVAPNLLHRQQHMLKAIAAQKEEIIQEKKLADFKVCVFSAAQYVKDFLAEPLSAVFPDSLFAEPQLDEVTAVLADGYDAVNIFVNDIVSAEVVRKLAAGGVKIITLRCAGYDRVDLTACAKHGIKVVRVPTYSPQSVAEHAVALMFALNRNVHIAADRVQQGNYTLSGLVGHQMYNRTVGVVGTGAIGTEAVRILLGLGCKVLANDLYPSPKVAEMGATYTTFEDILQKCDIVSLHCPLVPANFHMIDSESVAKMKPGMMLINVSRGGLIDSDALFDGLESGQIGSLGLDVYEKEGAVFFQDFTQHKAAQRMKGWDRQLNTLLSYPQVLMTPHCAFLTHEALHNIATTTIESLTKFALDKEIEDMYEAKPRY